MLDFLMDMKNAIADMVEGLGGNVSFVDLSKIPGFVGEHDYSAPQFNVVFWQGLSKLALDAINQLIMEDVIIAEPARVLMYAVDGVTLTLPIAEDFIEHSELRWLPLMINEGSNFYQFLEGEETAVSNG